MILWETNEEYTEEDYIRDRKWFENVGTMLFSFLLVSGIPALYLCAVDLYKLWKGNTH